MTIKLKFNMVISRPKWAQRGSNVIQKIAIISLLLGISLVNVSRSFSLYGEGSDGVHPGWTMPKSVTAVAGSGNEHFSLTTQYQNPQILREGCSVTVVLMDPNVGTGALWTLESVAEYIRPVETTCILIQTSICQEGSPDDETSTISMRYLRRTKRLEEGAQPLFRRMIHQGNVRMTVLDPTYYKLNSCENFYNPSYAWQNWHYWGPREFVEQDSDLVLMVQDDAVLCRPLDIRLWQDAAWVGAPWPASKGDKLWNYCSSMPASWEAFHEAKAVGRADHDRSQTIKFPPYPSPDQLCSDNMVGPQGNGGLSLRQRSWLRKAIEYCPTVAAGIDASEARCDAHTTIAEDSYFVTILRGMGAPLPSAYDAALFVWESRSVTQIVKQYNIVNETWKQERMARRWVPDEYLENRVSNSSTSDEWFVPIGIHKPWNQFFKDKMCHPQIHRDCKYLRHIIHNSKHGARELAMRRARGDPTADACFE
jgi:hypothetical protein